MAQNCHTTCARCSGCFNADVHGRPHPASDLETINVEIARAAGELLVSEDRARIKECANDTASGCSWTDPKIMAVGGARILIPRKNRNRGCGARELWRSEERAEINGN